MRKPAYCVKWWDTKGNAHISEPTDIQSAYTQALSMDIAQEAQIVLVYVNQSGGTLCPTTTKESYHA